MQQIIGVETAKKLVEIYSAPMPATLFDLQAAAGHVLAEKIIAPYSIPAYPQSSMDGYAFAHAFANNPLKLVGEMAAGSGKAFILEPGTAVRIFTGAAVPAGADTVLMQEKAVVENGQLIVPHNTIKPSENVRPIGSEITKGVEALEEGTLLTPAAIGYIAGMGIGAVNVIPMPAISIIVTGNELQQPGEPFHYGQVFEANSFTLAAALKQLGITNVSIERSPDDLDNLIRLLTNALEKSDIVLMTGGVSVGDYDFTLQAAESCGVENIFHKIKQKPGKPILFGKKGKKLLFGLPGNPASVLTCFYEYVTVALEKITYKKCEPKQIEAPLAMDYNKPAGLTHFLKGWFDGKTAHLFTGQESYKLNSFAKANCLIVIPEEITTLNAGDTVQVHLFPI